MGLRATSIKKYEVQYGSTSGFNWGVETLSNLIGEFCENFFNGSDGEVNSNEIWEVDRSEFVDMVNSIESMPEEVFNENMKDWFSQCGSPEDEGYTKEYTLRILKGFLEDTPEDETYVRIGWL